ncbi:MAG: hypothetical protein JST10_03355 [Bacteroidetes bacterium]|nr:hypothetical protein [Bacteroidota bacterium]
MMICYKWDFTVSIIRKSGKVHNRHSMVVLGCTYSLAHYDMVQTLKKHNATLISVVKVRVMSVAFALDDNMQFIKRTLADEMPYIPEDLNLNY